MILLSAGTSGFANFLQLIGVLIIFVFVLVVTYIVTKWIAGYQKGLNTNKNLHVIETLKITTNKYIQIIEAGDQYLVIAIGKDEVNLLTTLTKEQLRELPEDFQNIELKNFGESFQDVLERMKEHLPKKQDKS